jgi:hypothetical protein
VSFELLWPQLSALHSKEMQGDPVEWKVLFASRPRPLMIPAGCAEQAGAAIDFFVPNKLLRLWGRFMLAIDRSVPSLRLLPVARSERFPVAALFGEGALCETRFSIHCGSPGPLRKLTIYCPPQGPEGTGEICKIASQPSADESIIKEAHWLRTLGKSHAIARFLPKLLRDGVLDDGRHFLTMSALAYGVQSRRFGEPHVVFLQMLAERESATARWSLTEPYKRLSSRMDAVEKYLGPSHSALFKDVFKEISREIGQREIPVCLVHGDFAPWNLRVSGDQLFVFDLEYSEAGGNPLQDFLHFHLAARAAGERSISAWFMRRLIGRAADHAERVFGADSGLASSAGALTLHYLLDTVVFYIEASGCLDINDAVIRAYLKILDSRGEWLPDREPAKEANLGWQ